MSELNGVVHDGEHASLKAQLLSVGVKTLTLPSGITITYRRPSFPDALEAGLVFLPVTRAVMEHFGTDDEKSGSDLKPEEQQEMMRIRRYMISVALVSPALGPEEVKLMDGQDREALWSALTAPTEDEATLATFRDGDTSTDDRADGQDVRDEAELHARVG